jgi:hypothetical protein
MAPAASRRVQIVPLLQEAPVRANAAAETAQASLALPFALDDFEELNPQRDHDVNQSARHTAAAVRHLLTAAGTNDAITSAAAMAAAASNGDLLGMAQKLARLGYSTKLCSSSGGTLRSLKHSFLTASRPSAFGGELVARPQLLAAAAAAAARRHLSPPA